MLYRVKLEYSAPVERGEMRERREACAYVAVYPEYGADAMQRLADLAIRRIIGNRANVAEEYAVSVESIESIGTVHVADGATLSLGASMK